MSKLPRNVPIPPRMQHLDRDHRGYPIPVIVLVDNNGRTHFQINDEAKRQRVIRECRCPVCGDHLTTDDAWVAGGPLSAFHPQGTYIDTPAHYECIEYALKVCPYLALKKYSSNIQAKLTNMSAEEAEAFGEKSILVDPTMIDERPDVFVAVRSPAYTATVDDDKGLVVYMKPVRPYFEVEYWRHGEKLTTKEGKALIRAKYPDLLPKDPS